MNTKNISRKAPLAMALMCAIGFGMSESASAQYIDVDVDVVGDRPVEELFIGRTTYTQEAGTVQMSLSGGYEWNQNNRSSEVRGRAEYGVTDQLQLQAEFPISITDQRAEQNVTAQTSVSSVQVGAMYNISGMGLMDPIALSAGVDVDIPLGDQPDLSGSRMDAGTIVKPSLMVGKDFGEVELHSNIQAEIGESRNALNYSIGSIYTLGSLAPTLEVNSRAIEDQRAEFYATPGLYYNFSDRAELGVGVPIGLNDNSQPVGLMAKFNFHIR